MIRATLIGKENCLGLYKLYDVDKYDCECKGPWLEVPGYPIVMSTPSMSNAIVLCRTSFISRQVITSKPIKRESVKKHPPRYRGNLHIHYLSSLEALPSPQTSGGPSRAVVRERCSMGVERWPEQFLLAC